MSFLNRWFNSSAKSSKLVNLDDLPSAPVEKVAAEGIWFDQAIFDAMSEDAKTEYKGLAGDLKAQKAFYAKMVAQKEKEAAEAKLFEQLTNAANKLQNDMLGAISAVEEQAQRNRDAKSKAAAIRGSNAAFNAALEARFQAALGGTAVVEEKSETTSKVAEKPTPTPKPKKTVKSKEQVRWERLLTLCKGNEAHAKVAFYLTAEQAKARAAEVVAEQDNKKRALLANVWAVSTELWGPVPQELKTPFTTEAPTAPVVGGATIPDVTPNTPPVVGDDMGTAEGKDDTVYDTVTSDKPFG